MMRRDLSAARCPGCGSAGEVRSAWSPGFRFYCFDCEWSWGHPQSMTYDEALEVRRTLVETELQEGRGGAGQAQE